MPDMNRCACLSHTCSYPTLQYGILCVDVFGAVIKNCFFWWLYQLHRPWWSAYLMNNLGLHSLSLLLKPFYGKILHTILQVHCFHLVIFFEKYLSRALKTIFRNTIRSSV